MAYTKPTVVAQNSVAGSFAAGCPANNNGSNIYPESAAERQCKSCERTT